MIVMQIFFLDRWAHFKAEWQQGLSAPEIDQQEQFANICSPIPSSLTGFLFFFVFGTTAESKAQIRQMYTRVLQKLGIRKPAAPKTDEFNQKLFDSPMRARTVKRDSDFSWLFNEQTPEVSSPMDTPVHLGSPSGRNIRPTSSRYSGDSHLTIDTARSKEVYIVPNSAEYFQQNFQLPSRVSSWAGPQVDASVASRMENTESPILGYSPRYSLSRVSLISSSSHEAELPTPSSNASSSKDSR